MKISPLPILLLAAFVFLTLSSCMTTGRKFPEENVKKIEIGKTTQQDVKELFGPPWRTGMEDGLTTWTYGSYHYQMLGTSGGSDLVVRFDDNGKVVSYSYSAPNPEAR